MTDAKITFWVVSKPDGTLYLPATCPTRDGAMQACFGGQFSRNGKDHWARSLEEGWKCHKVELDNSLSPIKAAIDTKKLAEFFCGWSLPDSVCADRCATDAAPHKYHRSGTNLLTVAEAKQFFDLAVAAGLLSAPTESKEPVPLSKLAGVAPAAGAELSYFVAVDYDPNAGDPPEDVGYYGVHVPDLPGCNAMGKTLGGVMANIKAAMVEWLRDDQPVPVARSETEIRSDYRSSSKEWGQNFVLIRVSVIV